MGTHSQDFNSDSRAYTCHASFCTVSRWKPCTKVEFLWNEHGLGLSPNQGLSPHCLQVELLFWCLGKVDITYSWTNGSEVVGLFFNGGDLQFNKVDFLWD